LTRHNDGVGSYQRAAQAFAKTLKELGVKASEATPAFGRRAALDAVAGRIWDDHLGPMLESREVQELLGVTRQAVSDFRKRRRMLGLPRGDGRIRFPAFQFHRGKIRPEIAAVLIAFKDAKIGDYTQASWFRSPQSLLGNKTPAEWLERGGDRELLLEAARRAAFPLSW
jgi:hypothetical protein